LVFANHFGLGVAGRKRHQYRSDQAHQGYGIEVNACLLGMGAAQCVCRANGCHHERTCYQGRALVVRKLHQTPGIEQVSRQVGKPERAIGSHNVADRVLHEGIGDYYE
jgi:hypothetical protein